MDIYEHLMKTGLTRHEAVMYLTLCTDGDLTGYEAAKISGVPRSNAYLALAGLVDKGAAYVVESEALRYTAVPVHEWIANKRRELEETFRYLQANVPVRKEPIEPYITIKGTGNVTDAMKNVILQAKERIYISMSGRELALVAAELQDACERNLKVVIIGNPELPIEGATVYRVEKEPGPIRLIADTATVITGEMKDRGDASCLFSRNQTLIALIKDSLTNEMKLIQMNEDLEKKEERRDFIEQ